MRDAALEWHGLIPDGGPLLGDGDLVVSVRVVGSSVVFAFAGTSVVLELAGQPTTGRWSLDLWDAELHATIGTTRGRVRLTALVHRGLHVSATAEDGERTTLRGAIGKLVTSPDISAHRARWRDFYRTSYLSVPDPLLRRFYWRQLYAAAATGPRWCPPLVATANHLSLASTSAPPPSSPAGLPGAGWKTGYAVDPFLAAELPAAWRLWQHTGDDAFLRDWLRPELARAAGHYTGFLTEGADGLLHLPPTSGDLPDATHELSLLRWTAAVLGDDPSWRAIGERLTPYHADTSGVLLGAGTRLTASRPDPTHLLWLHPLREKTWRAEADRLPMRASFEHWASMPELWNSSSHAAAAAMATAVHDPTATARHLSAAVAGLPADVLGTPVALTVADALAGSLLDADPGVVEVFPATSWADATFTGLRAPGGFLVDAVRTSGRTEQVRVLAERGGPLLLRHGIPGRCEVATAGRVLRSGDGVVVPRLAPGDSVTVTRRS